MIDFILLGILGVVVWLLSSEGPWSTAITFVSVLLGGLIATNYFEPVADIVQSSFASSVEWQNRLDIITFLGIFSLSVFALRALGDVLLPTYAEVNGHLYQVARWAFAVLTGYALVAILCVSLHLAPLPREYLGFTPERSNFLGMAPDRQWLALVQHASERSLQRVRADGRPVIFDGPTFAANPADQATVQVWSSFPIKYAARRQQYASGSVAQAQPAAPLPPSTGGRGRSNQNPQGGTGGF